jgi:hypothetical protein
VLVWVYYSAQIFLLGAEFTKTFAYSHGTRRDQTKPAARRAQSQSQAAAKADAAIDGGGETAHAAAERPRGSNGGDSRANGIEGMPAKRTAGAKRTPEHADLIAMDVGHPLAEPAMAAARSELAKVRIAAGIAAAVGLLAGEILNELRERRLMRVRRA